MRLQPVLANCRYYARGVFAADGIVQPQGGTAAAVAGVLPALDWPLRAATRGGAASGLSGGHAMISHSYHFLLPCVAQSDGVCGCV